MVMSVTLLYIRVCQLINYLIMTKQIKFYTAISIIATFSILAFVLYPETAQTEVSTYDNDVTLLSVSLYAEWLAVASI